MLRKRRCVLLVDPDAWRFDGIKLFLNNRGVDVVEWNAGAKPDAILLSEKVIESVPRLRASYPEIPILVHGDSDSIETTAAILADGVQGYFPLSSPQSQILTALD